MSVRNESDVFVCPPDHKHGETSTCHTAHACRCADCRASRRDYEYYRRHLVEAGKWIDRDSSVDATGTRRRIQALMYMGWPTTVIAKELGTTQGQAWSLSRKKRVTAATRRQVMRLYDRVWDQVPPGGRRTYSMGRARRLGWVGPLAWDDIDIDEAPASVDGGSPVDDIAIELAIRGDRNRLTQPERHAVVRRLHAARWSDSKIAAHLGVADQTIFRDRKELELAAWSVSELNEVERGAA